MKKAHFLILLLLSSYFLVIPISLGATDEGYGEDQTSLGQLVDSFENDNNISVMVDLIVNTTLEGVELNWTAGIAGPWLAGWTYRKSHLIIGSSVGALTDYQIRFTIYYGSGVDSGEDIYLNSNCETDFSDIRFTNASGIDLIDYWIEEQVDSNYAIVWVEIPLIPIDPNTALIYIYYGNSSVASASNGDDTFPDFIDMEDGTINEWDATFGTAAKTASTDHPHTGTYDARLIPAGGVPGPSGYRQIISAYDDGWAYRIWIYDVPTKAGSYAETAKMKGGGGNSIYLTANGFWDYYYYWDGAGYIQTAILRTAGFHYFEFRVRPASIDLVVDGTVVRTSTRLTETALSDIEYYCYRANPNPTWFDDYLIRKWVDPEPTHSNYGAESNQAGYQGNGYFTTFDYLNNTVCNGTALSLLTNSTIPVNTGITVEFSNDNSTWILNDWEPIFGGFESIDLRILNYTDIYFRYNLSTIDNSITPRLYQVRIISTIGGVGPGPSGGEAIGLIMLILICSPIVLLLGWGRRKR